jgi:hypothetical protein
MLMEKAQRPQKTRPKCHPTQVLSNLAHDPYLRQIAHGSKIFLMKKSHPIWSPCKRMGLKAHIFSILRDHPVWENCRYSSIINKFYSM